MTLVIFILQIILIISALLAAWILVLKLHFIHFLDILSQIPSACDYIVTPPRSQLAFRSTRIAECAPHRFPFGS